MESFSTPAVFQDRILPHRAELAGYSALVHAYSVQAPVRQPSCVSLGSVKGTRREEDGWMLFDKRLAPEPTFAGHLTFALRHEPLDLLALKRIFLAAGPEPVEAMVNAHPTSSVARRAWFFYEWLTDKKLGLRDAERGNYVDAVDPEEYFSSEPIPSPRHRVRDNLLGNPEFCPVVRKSPVLVEYVGSRWDTQAKEEIGKINPAVVARAASFMLLADSQASYQIEGERPPRNRLERWMRAVAQAGRRPVTIAELERLQSIVIEDNRFIESGLRTGFGFIGHRDPADHSPVPEFISARPEDVPSLVQGIIQAGKRMQDSGVDAVLQAAAQAFGFVFVHPFADGNGRLHRYLIHHVLAERGYTPPGVIFPVSTVLLEREQDYQAQLRSFTGPLMPFIEWVPTEDLNVRVLNETGDLYRYGDYTEIGEFLYSCVIRTITVDFPKEVAYLKSFDEAKRRIQDMIEMPDPTVSLLINFVTQNNGRLPKKRRRNEFAALTDEEVAAIEAVIAEAFDLRPDEPVKERDLASR